MRKLAMPLILAASLAALAGCTNHGAVGVGVAAGDYYDGFYGPFNDGYWGNDGFFWYRDNGRAWHRDESHHFAHDAGTGRTWNHIHGSGLRREH